MEHAPKFDIATLWETKRQNDLFWRSVLAYGNYEDKIALAIADSLSKKWARTDILTAWTHWIGHSSKLPVRSRKAGALSVLRAILSRDRPAIIQLNSDTLSWYKYRRPWIYCRCNRSKASKDSFSREYRTVLCPPGGNALYDQWLQARKKRSFGLWVWWTLWIRHNYHSIW